MLRPPPRSTLFPYTTLFRSLSGGRYDQLFKRFGAAELTAIGWSLDIDSVYQAIHDDLPDEGGKEGDSR